MPDQFIEALEKIVVITYVASVLLAGGFFLKMIKKRHYSYLLSLISVAFLLAVVSLFYVGTSKLSDASIGVVQGSGSLSLTLDGESLVMQAQWGFDIGFYLLVIATLFVLGSFLGEVCLNILGKRDRHNSKE